MKLLGWMNRKSRQDSTEPRKTFSIGNPCASLYVQSVYGKQPFHLEHGYTSAHSKQTKKECSRYSAGFTAMEEEFYDEQADFFHGILTVGTLGSESRVEESATPKFANSYENLNEKQTEVTETELKLMNEKLEKFLEGEAADDVDYDSSKRSSFVSTITLSNYQIEGNDAEENKNTVTCPLQECLFHSSKECLETGEEMKKEKVSLEENYKTIGQLRKEQKEEGTPFKGKCVKDFMKKIFKKFHVSSRSSKASANDHATCTVSTKWKIPKVFRQLDKKIHPETSIADKKISKSHDYKETTKHHLKNGNDNFPEMINMKEKVITNTTVDNDSLHRSHSTGTTERWINTDADYFVLEL